MNELINVTTDWWAFGATIFSGVLAAISTIVAVIYTNKKNNEQLYKQKIEFAKEREEQFKQSKYVVLQPTLMINKFVNVLDRLVVQNNYSRVFLFSGDDGFDFFDDNDKRASQACRMLLVENKSSIDIKDVEISTRTTLSNTSTNEQTKYETTNVAGLLRGGESIIVRLANQIQFMKLLEMNKKKIPSSLSFFCEIEYSTMGNQRISYSYNIVITNDLHIEIKKDEISNIVDDITSVKKAPTVFRNLQDYIANIDRQAYNWEKIGVSQMRGIMSEYFPNQIKQTPQNENTDIKKENDGESGNA